MAIITKIKILDTILENRWASEFFDPNYVFHPNEKYKWERIGNVLTKCQYGMSVSMNENGDGQHIFRMNEIEDCFLTTPMKYANISTIEFEQFKLRPNDVLFNRTNSIDFVGRTGILKNENPSVFASYLVRVNTNENLILPEFLTIYLNTKFGKGQIRRRAMPSINQANVSASELKRIYIPLIGLDSQKKIVSLVNESFILKSESLKRYTQAANLFDEELGLDKVQLKSQQTYTASFSEILNRIRFDGEYYAPKFKQLKNIVKQYKNGSEFFLTNIQSIKPNINPSQNPNKDFDYIELSNINPSLGIINGSKKVNGSLIPSRAKRLVKSGDIIASSVVGSVDKAGIITEKEDGYLASSGFFHFRSSFYTPEFLLILVRNSFFIEQLYQESTGGILSAVSDSSLKNLIIPKIKPEIQEEITELVKNSHSAYRNSKSLLGQAKTEVESLIEKAVISAS